MLSIMTLSITTLSIMTLSIMTFSIMVKCGYTVSFMLTVMYSECHKLALYAECHNAECRYAMCHYAECHVAISPTNMCNVQRCQYNLNSAKDVALFRQHLSWNFTTPFWRFCAMRDDRHNFSKCCCHQKHWILSVQKLLCSCTKKC